MQMKNKIICTRCNKEKDANEFSKNKSAKSGRNSWCKECYKINSKSKKYHRKYLDNTDNLDNSDNTIITYRGNIKKIMDKINSE